jgi:hypothetical protein
VLTAFLAFLSETSGREMDEYACADDLWKASAIWGAGAQRLMCGDVLAACLVL